MAGIKITVKGAIDSLQLKELSTFMEYNYSKNLHKGRSFIVNGKYTSIFLSVDEEGNVELDNETTNTI